MITTPRLSGLWHHPDFRKFWAAQTISLCGSELSRLAIPLIAALTLGATPREMGLLAAAGTMPYLLFGLTIGTYVDRQRRRPLLIAADLGRAALVGAVPLLAWLGALHLIHLYPIVFLHGLLSVLFGVASGAYLPALLRQEELVEGNSRLAFSTAVAEGSGPAFASLLVQLLSAPIALLGDACSFLASALALRTIATPEPPPQPTSTQPGWQAFLGGVRFIASSPPLRTTTAINGLGNLQGGITDALLIYYLTVTLGLPPLIYGGLYALGSASGIVTALFATPLTNRLGFGRAFTLAALLLSVGWLSVPLASGPPPLLIPLLLSGGLLFGAGNTLTNILGDSLRQTITPPALLGRVGAANLVISYGALPLGALLGGLLSGWLGVRTTLLLTMLLRLALLIGLLAPQGLRRET